MWLDMFALMCRIVRKFSRCKVVVKVSLWQRKDKMKISNFCGVLHMRN